MIYEKADQGLLKKIYIDRVITRLGEGFSEDLRLLTPNAVDRSIKALRSFSGIARKHNVDKIRAVATSVVRESSNGPEFVKTVKDETGLTVEIISGEEEAELTVLGTLNSVSAKTDNNIIFDIGGGSTEYVHIQNSNIISLTSTNLGVVHLTEQFFNNDIETQDEINQLVHQIQKTLQTALKPFNHNKNNNFSLIGTAGTPTTLAAIQLGLKNYKPELVNGFLLKKNTVTTIVEKLIRTPKSERTQIPGLERGREDIIISGSLILLETLDYFSSKEVIVSDGGVLEGIAHSLYQ